MIEDLNLNPEEVILGQGTLRPDLIESASGLASGQADVIKTHHNDTELVRKLRDQNRVVEPLAEFHKDEVRRKCRKEKKITKQTTKQNFVVLSNMKLSL